MPSDPAPYAAAWRSYRRRRRAFLALTFAGWVIPIGVGALLSALLQPEVAREALVVLFFLWATSAVLAWLAWVFFPCPRCGRLFHGAPLGFSPLFVWHCGHCRLPRWAKGP